MKKEMKRETGFIEREERGEKKGLVTVVVVVGNGLGLAIFDAFGRSLSFSTDLSLISVLTYHSLWKF